MKREILAACLGAVLAIAGISGYQALTIEPAAAESSGWPRETAECWIRNVETLANVAVGGQSNTGPFAILFRLCRQYPDL